MTTLESRIRKIIGVLIFLAGMAYLSDQAWACNGFLVREEVNAVHRICYYNHMGSEAAITQVVASVCPTTVLFSHTV